MEEQVVSIASDWGTLATSLGVASILAWYLYYTTSVTFPRLNRESHESNERICKNFTESLREEREFHRESISALRSDLKCKAKTGE